MRKDYSKMAKEPELKGKRAKTAVVDEAAAPEILAATKPQNDLKNGVVVDCTRLNVRSDPDKKGSVVCILDVGETILIEDGNEEWTHIYTNHAIDGYVMTKFIREV